MLRAQDGSLRPPVRALTPAHPLGAGRRVVYFYAGASTTHVSEPDGTQLYHFPNGQVERHFTDGLKEIRFHEGGLKVILPDGQVQHIDAA